MGDNTINTISAGIVQTDHINQYKTALSGNVAAICFYLKNKAGWKDSIEYKGNGMGTTVHVYPQRVLVFKDLKQNDDAGTSNIDAEEGASRNRIGQEV